MKDTGLFESLFKMYRKPLVGYANSYVRNWEDAEDLVQEVFIQIWEKIREMREDKHICGLLFVATKNKCISFLRGKLHEHARFLQEESAESLRMKIDLVALEYSALETIEFEELLQQYERVLATLPEDYRRFFLQSRNEGLAYADIARNEGISVKTVEKKMSATLRALRNGLKDYGERITLWICLFITKTLL